jgi:hypothetical protein
MGELLFMNKGVACGSIRTVLWLNCRLLLSAHRNVEAKGQQKKKGQMFHQYSPVSSSPLAFWFGFLQSESGKIRGEPCRYRSHNQLRP